MCQTKRLFVVYLALCVCANVHPANVQSKSLRASHNDYWPHKNSDPGCTENLPVNINGTCCQKVAMNNACVDSKQCEMFALNTFCSSDVNRCKCREGFQPDWQSTSCIPIDKCTRIQTTVESGLSLANSERGDCKGQNKICITGICGCQRGFRLNQRGQCELKPHTDEFNIKYNEEIYTNSENKTNDKPSKIDDEHDISSAKNFTNIIVNDDFNSTEPNNKIQEKAKIEENQNYIKSIILLVFISLISAAMFGLLYWCFIKYLRRNRTFEVIEESIDPTIIPFITRQNLSQQQTTEV